MIGGRWGQIVDEPLEAGEAGQGGAAPAHRGAADQVGGYFTLGFCHAKMVRCYEKVDLPFLNQHY